ncbi:MAG: UDP-N-acetylglucosamine--N-acetylmuramyl-(pentapeptide) pyrophosphoryl-undecaprenol N-acetylglucosamine transferase, partial [Clostridia bacterium]|nr:UDP-N-acetylglucosamine--N-acetylmuramyl-(pentapeptide) pyrophosphoryl-undecaprenol N-acetylglucosamine transferase [Clostridia bacterium]
YINNAVAGLIEWHNGTGRFYHIHGTGKSGYEAMVNSLKEKKIELAPEIDVREYIKNMNECMAAADLVISRAGAITLSEITAMGKPAILIPSPYVAENHQFHNAMTLKRAGAAEIIEEKDLTAERLIEVVNGLIDNKPRLKEMAENARKIAIVDANERIYDVLMELYNKA